MFWPFCARTPLRETLEWRTNVIATQDGEQRIRLRNVPRRTFEASYGLDDRRLEYASNFGRAQFPGPIDLPLWHEWRELTASAAPADITVSVDTTSASFVDGGKALLWNDWNDAEVMTIDSLTGSSLTFTAGITGTYAVGARCMPVVDAYAPEGLTVSRNVNNFRDGQISWRVADGFNTGSVSDLTWPTYQGDPLFIDCVRLGSGSFEDRTTREVFIIDADVGKPAYDTSRDFAERTTTLSWVMSGQADLWTLRGQLEAIAGRWRAFWAPVSNMAIRLTSTATAGAGTITIQDAGLHLGGAGDLFFRRKDDTTLAIRYTSSSQSGVNEVVTLAAPLPENIVPSTLKTSCRLLRVRLASDSVSIEHEAPRIATVIAPCIEIPL